MTQQQCKGGFPLTRNFLRVFTCVKKIRDNEWTTCVHVYASPPYIVSKGWFSYDLPDRFYRRCRFKKFACDRGDHRRTLQRRSLTSATIGAITIASIAHVPGDRSQTSAIANDYLWELLSQRETIEGIQTVPWCISIIQNYVSVWPPFSSFTVKRQ